MPPLAQLGAPAANLVDLLLDLVDSDADLPSVGFELRFAGPSRADAAAQPGERDARADEPREQVLELRELDLPLSFLGSRAPGEDVENELRPVEHLPLDERLDIAELRRRELVVEDHHVDVCFVAGERDQIELALSDEGRRVGPRPLLRHTQGDIGAGGVGEAGQFLERLFGNMTALGPGDKAHERSALTPGTGHVNHRKEEQKFSARDPTVSRPRARGAARHR